MLSFAAREEGLAMHSACFHWGVAAAIAILILPAGSTARAADEGDVRTVAEELGQRTKPTAPEAQQKGGLSDSAVRVLMGYAFSVIPEERLGPDGKPVKLDKSDPTKFLIPHDDARRVIRAATRSAYAEACELPDLAQANYQALMRSEGSKKVWSELQLLMVNALYLFSASYFAGNVNIAETEQTGDASASGTAGASQQAAPDQGTSLVTPKRPQCPPEQKQKVVAAINAYVQSVRAPAPKGKPQSAEPATTGSN
jgi:hypothetical protein